MTFSRARRPEQKQQRRDAILAAARELAVKRGVREVSLGALAAAVGLAKSNVVRYFGTREEVFLTLAAAEWRAWAEAVTARLATGDGLVTVLVDTLAERHLFCDLLAHSPTSLEHNISVEAAREFKTVVIATIAALGAQAAAADPSLPEQEATELVMLATALAGTLHAVTNPPPTIAELYAQDPEIAAVCPPFSPTLHRALTACARGFQTMR
ncbi:TetR family transcriptional regulator [Nonomuraea sp. NPDC050790]|uniref:TetR/AcrR family transcriptional regulator n=1 Tax=Nonomuraea sp. NPDC050790 TaxID=3364371 RepID=UPI003787C203